MKTKHLFSLLGITLLIFNCSSGDDDPTSNPDPDPSQTTVTYNGKIKGIVSNNCLTCHGSPTANGAPMSLTKYELVKNAVETRGLLERINSTTNPMPQGGLMSQANRDAFQQWKDQGFLEN